MSTPVYGYDKNKDYEAMIQQAVAAGDMARAAIYEAQRNEKIAGEGITAHQQTSRYANYLPGEVSSGWVNPYRQELDATLKRLQNTDEYKKAYLQQADRTMQDTLGQYAAMTGGLPSTQAVAAASQASDYYKAQLAQRLPELERQNASLLLSAGQQAQSDYQMRISEALDRWTKLGYADKDVAGILGVAIGTPTTDQSYVNWQKGQQSKEDAYTTAMTLLQAGQMPNADTLAAAGIRAEDAQAIIAAVQEQQNKETAQMAKEDAYAVAMMLLQAGQMPNADTLTAAGIRPEDAQLFIAAVQAEQNKQDAQLTKEDAYTIAMMLLQAGQMPSAETLAEAGIRPEDAQLIISAVQASQSSGGGSYTYTGNNTDLKKPDWEEIEELIALVNSGDMQTYYSRMDWYAGNYYDTDWIDALVTSATAGGQPNGGYNSQFDAGTAADDLIDKFADAWAGLWD